MALSLQKAFEAAEEQRNARQRVAKRVVIDAATRQGLRIELLEVYATWDHKRINKLENFIGAYMVAYDFDHRGQIGGAEDLLQEAIVHTLRWPPSDLRPDLLEHLVLWIAKRNFRVALSKARERNEASLDQNLGSEDDAGSLGDLIASQSEEAGERGMNTSLELWYVERYICDLLEAGRSDEQIAAFLGVRLRVVEHMRARLRDQLQVPSYVRLSQDWPPARCIQKLREYAADHGGWGPTQSEQVKSDVLPPATALVRHFGSRRKGMEAAGVRPRTVGGGTQPRQLDKIETSKKLLAWVREHGHWPTATEQTNANGLPNHNALARLYGGSSRFDLYSGVLKALGRPALDGVEPPPGGRWVSITPRAAAENIFRWKEEHGQWPTSTDLETDSSLISSPTARKIFGSANQKKLATAVMAILGDPANRDKEANAPATLA